MTSANCCVPWSLKTMFTDHWPVDTPWLLWTMPAEASEMSVPETSTGPSANFSVPVTSQVTSG